ncbi:MULTISPECIES: MarC family protein [unclassified Shewanella]|uniref:MarC family protein n=1 Tax=unclassified Shewanella TaxID=196818 RepID=UPI001BC609D1|nr:MULTISPECIES: MarC family protein [unclassified Shewanella]GIU13454.1 UPF0056 inner membrane protein [Shewanella sp. MBTL60-112-B1]GIU27466.1 UPF0056 inner membrane protein [Shewanella sp. MBTL60-112-B2]
MDGIWIHFATVFMGFFAIMNPVANVPIFLGLTSNYDEKTTRAIAFRALIIAFAITCIFAISGQLIFNLFGISLPAFRITGGLLIFLIGFHMLQGNQSTVHHDKESPSGESLETKLSVAVSPLALPILAGPGTITTAMNFTAAGGGVPELVSTIVSFVLLCLITYISFIFGGRLVSYLGSAALGAITRMMGLILAVIGTQMAVEGLQGAFKVLG